LLSLQDLKLKFPLQSIYQKSNKLIFESSEGYLAYEKGPLSYVVAGDPILNPGGTYLQLMQEFLKFAHKKKRSVCGYYFSEGFKRETPFKFIQAGSSGFLDLTDYSLHGKVREPVRRALNFGYRNNYKYFEIPHNKKSLHYDQIKSLEERWLKAKKRPKVSFVLSPVSLKFGNSHQERWFVAKNEFGHLGSFVSILPYSDGAYYIDQLIYNPESQRMSLDFLISKLIMQLKKQNVKSLCFGFNAFKVEGRDNFYERTLELFYKYPFLYNARGVYQFKSKYFDYEVPRYIMLEQEASAWKQLLSMGAVTFLSH
jgi:lysylphosphatidylglycerol synthetase-like protein (DUF2156 family)